MADAVYSLYDREALCEILETFYAATGLALRVINAQGETLDTFGPDCRYCAKVRQCALSEEVCRQAHLDGGRQALALGETYIFACPGNLNHIAFALARGQALLGAIVLGPFLMDAPDSTLLSELGEQRAIPAAALLDLYDELQAVPVFAPARVNSLNRLLDLLLRSALPAERVALKENREMLYQQARIGETIQMYKAQGEQEGDYPYELEKELLSRVRASDAPAAKGVLNDLLGYVLFSEGMQLESVKNRSLELCTLLSRIAIEGGALTSTIFRLSNAYLSQLREIGSVETLCLRLQKIVEAFTDTMFYSADRSGSEPVRRAIGYIARHYTQNISVRDVAAYVGLSPNYFAQKFRSHTGCTLREYVNQLRVEESKRLLAASGMGLADIAVAMGFNDQSYFTKVFHKYTGLTPAQFR